MALRPKTVTATPQGSTAALGFEISGVPHRLTGRRSVTDFEFEDSGNDRLVLRTRDHQTTLTSHLHPTQLEYNFLVYTSVVLFKKMDSLTFNLAKRCSS